MALWENFAEVGEIFAEASLTQRPYTISFLAVVLLVGLRVVIGWHFFQEGLTHKNDPNWSSEGFLHQARGPLADYYKSYAPGFHHWDYLVAIPLGPEPAALPNEGNPAGGSAKREKPAADKTAAEALPNEGNPAGGSAKPAAKPTPADSPVYGKWYGQVLQDWAAENSEIANFYHFSDEQKQSVDKLLDEYAAKLGQLLAENEADISAYRHELYRNQEMAAQPGATEIPNEKTRLAKREQNPLGEPGVEVSGSPADWQSDAQALQSAMQRDVLALRTNDQIKLGPAPEMKTDLKKIDTAITWLLIIGGGLLIVGLFTRLSALALAIFLLAVIASQPPWIASPMPPYYQGVECVALLALACLPVGRWAGLDFFIYHILFRPFRSR